MTGSVHLSSILEHVTRLMHVILNLSAVHIYLFDGPFVLGGPSLLAVVHLLQITLQVDELLLRRGGGEVQSTPELSKQLVVI